jgi:hypothetical protein
MDLTHSHIGLYNRRMARASTTSDPFNANLLYRLTEVDGGTQISFKHTLVGPFPEDHRSLLGSGWAALHARVRATAETAGRE